MRLIVIIASVIYYCQCDCSDSSDSSEQRPLVTQLIQPVEHAEGPHWDSENQLLFFVDISGHKLYQWDPDTDKVTYVDVGGAIGFAIPVESDDGGHFIAGRDHDLVSFSWTGETNVTLSRADQEVLATVDKRDDQLGNRWNDAKADAEGRLWAGTLGAEVNGVLDRQKGSLYSLDTDSDLPFNHIAGVDISNGIAWNDDNTVMYYIDTPTRRVDAYDYDLETGDISNCRTVFNMSDYDVIKGNPDGMTIDTDGNLWIALYGGYAVIKVDPATGKLLLQLGLPVNQVTSVAFGGDDLATLYITTSRRGLTKVQRAQQPMAGSVFAAEGLGVQGLPSNNVKRGVANEREWLNY